MDTAEIAAINTERLGRWQKHLTEEHATPIVLLGIGHNHKLDQLVVCATEDTTDDEIRTWLMGAINALNRRN